MTFHLPSAGAAELPRELSPWRTTLAIFPPRLALIFGGWLRRLAPVIGPIRVHGRDTGSEPDGYHGLIRRGHYERLLTSEWLMAEEAPLEFLRRAAMGEHLFLHLVRREPRGALRSVALFDAGPSQLGTPRLAHLALLILLAERAMAAGAEFHWGLLQGSEEPLREDAGVESVRYLLEGRSPFEAGPRHFEDWQRRLGQVAVDDLWVIGSGGSELAGMSRSRVVVEDPLDPHRRFLTVHIERCSRPVAGPSLRGPATGTDGLGRDISFAPLRGDVEPQARIPGADLELELPGADVCTRLLRQPFALGARVSRTTALSPAAGNAPVFSLNGHRLLVAAEGGVVVAYHVPRSAKQAPGHAKSFLPMPGEELVAAGFTGRRLLLATLAGRRLFIHGAGTAGQRRKTHRTEIELPSGLEIATLTENDRVTPCHQVTLEGGEKAVMLVDRVGAVFRARPYRPGLANGAATESLGVERIWQRVTAVAAARDKLVAVVAKADNGGWSDERCVAILEHGKNVDELPIDPGDGDLTTCFGVGGDLAHPLAGFLAIRDRKDSWILIYGCSRRRLTPGAGTRVVGVARSRQDGGAPALVIVDDDARTLVLVGLRFTRRLHRSSHLILGAMTSGAEPYLAYRNSGGEIVVLSLVSQQPVVRIRPAPADGDAGT